MTRLNTRDKEILKEGKFTELGNLMFDHFSDSKWIVEAHKYWCEKHYKDGKSRFTDWE